MTAIDSQRTPLRAPTTSTADRRMKQVLWWICLLAAPLVLITIELFHPANFTASPGMYDFLSHAEHYDPKYQALGYFGPEWWLFQRSQR